MQDYKNYLAAKGYSSGTIKGFTYTAIKFLRWLSSQAIELSMLSYGDMLAYIKACQQRSIKARSIQLSLMHINHYLNYLVEAGQLRYNPTLMVKTKNVKRKIVYNILSPEELEAIYSSYREELPQTEKAPPQELNKLARKRNKIIVGLLVYQGVDAGDIKNIELSHLVLREGKITIPGTRRSNERSLKLEAHQIFELYDYVNAIRKQILSLTKKTSTKLFTSVGTSENVQNLIQKLTRELKQQHPQMESLQQLRASVITHWLKRYNKRKVQYMAGHRYVSSTEAYEANNIDALQDDLQKYYPQL